MGRVGASVARFSRKYPHAVGFLIFFAGWAVLCLPWLSGAVTIPYDAKAHFQAQIQFLANAINSGQSPFWNPNAFAGQPQIADPQSLIFSPAIILAFLTPTPSFQLVDTFVFLLLGLGGASTILLFREMRWPVAGAVVAAFAFSFGASAALRIQHIGQIDSLTFFMLTQWLMVRTLNRARKRDGIALGVAAALMVVKPDQVALLGVYALALHPLWHICASGSAMKELRRLLAPLLVGAAVCIAIVGIPLLLTYLFVETTTRAVIPFEEAARGSLHPASLLTSVVADLFGAIDPKVEYWGPFSTVWGDKSFPLTQNMGQVYIGALPAMVILILGVMCRRAWDRIIRFYAVAALFMLVYALGVHTPMFRIAYDWLPGVSGFRRPADATFLLGAYAAIVSGYLVNLLPDCARFQQLISEHRRTWSLAAICTVFAISLMLAWFTGKLDVAAPKALASLMWCFVAGGIALFIGQQRIAMGGVSVLALATLMVADLRANNGPNESTALPPGQYDVLHRGSLNATISEVKRLLSLMESPNRRDRVEIVGVGFHWPNAGLVHRIENILGYNPLRLDTYSKATGAQDQVAGWDQRHFSPLFPSYKSLLANMLGLRLIVSGVPIEKIDPSLRKDDFFLVARTPDAWIYENPRALPRVMFATEWRVADFQELISSGKWPKFDPRRTVLLESEPNPMRPSPQQSGFSSARIISYENTRITIETDSTQPGFLVLNDIWHPWWSAHVDGTEVEIMQANVLFRAVQLTAGRHRIVFEFNPVTGAIAELRERLFDRE